MKNLLPLLALAAAWQPAQAQPTKARLPAPAPTYRVTHTPNGEDGTLTVVRTDAANGKFPVVQTLTTAPGAHTIALDPATHRLYLPTGNYGPAPAPTAAVPRPRRSVLPGTFRVLEVRE